MRVIMFSLLIWNGGYTFLVHFESLIILLCILQSSIKLNHNVILNKAIWNMFNLVVLWSFKSCTNLIYSAMTNFILYYFPACLKCSMCGGDWCMYSHEKAIVFPCVNFSAWYNKEIYLFLKRLQQPKGQKVTGTMTNVGHLIRYEMWESLMGK